MSELVSILIPAYNAEKWIGETIRSARNQTWPETEIIVIDDGSSDRTAEIARSFKSSSIKVVTQENAGPCVARNAAYAISQGDFIQWLDADDLLAPDKIERQMQRSQGGAKSKILLSAAWGKFYGGLKRARFEPTSVWQDLSPRELLVQKFSDNAHLVLHSWLISRRLAELAGPWDVRLQRTDADGEYSCRLVAASERILFVPEARCYYRKGLRGSLSATRTSIREEELLLRLLFDHLLSLEDSPETRDACMHWLKGWGSYYYLTSPETVNVVSALAKHLDRSIVSVPRSWKVYVAEKLLGWKGASAMRSKVSSIRALIRAQWESALGVLKMDKG